MRGVPDRIVGGDRIGECAHRPAGLPPEETSGLEATVFFRQDHPAFGFGAGIAVVTLEAKGIGEGEACMAPPAIVGAVVDALAPFGIRHVDMPLTPEKIWRLVRASGG